MDLGRSMPGNRRACTARRRLRTQRLAPLALIIIGGLLVGASVAVVAVQRALSHPGDAPLPGTLVGLTLEQAQYGAEAVAEVTRLHAQSFPLTSGAMGMYGRDGEATLWVAGTVAEFVAAEMLRAMGESIAQSETPFTPLGEGQRDGRSVHELTGMGQQHFYFQAGKQIIWLAVEDDLAELAIQEALEVYR